MSSDDQRAEVKRYGACITDEHPHEQVGHLDLLYRLECRCECHAEPAAVAPTSHDLSATAAEHDGTSLGPEMTMDSGATHGK